MISFGITKSTNSCKLPASHSWRNTAWWLVHCSCSCSFLTQPWTTCPRTGASHAILIPLVSIANGDNSPQTCSNNNLMKTNTSLGFLFQINLVCDKLSFNVNWDTDHTQEWKLITQYHYFFSGTFKTFFKFWFFGNFTLCIQSHLLPSPSMSALYPCRFLQNKANKKKTKIIFHWSVFQPLHHIIFYHRGLGSYHVSHSISLYLNSFTCKCSLRWVVGLAQVLWLLINH